MDDVARAFFELRFENVFLKKRGDAFQDFFSTIMEKRHPGDFIRVRPWGSVGDRKNDGYLRSERKLFQVYAPNEMKATIAIAKIEEDFSGALLYWERHFDVWVFVHNAHDGLGPDVTKKLLELDGDHELEVTHWGFEELRRKAFELGPEELASLLGPAPTRRTILDVGMEALAPVLEQIASMAPPPQPDLRPPPADKIKRNMLSDHVATLLRAGMTRVDLVRSYFRIRPRRKDEIAEAFRFRYNVLRDEGRSPDEVFVELQRYAAGDAIPNASSQGAVLAVLAFLFEECDIFEYGDDNGGDP